MAKYLKFGPDRPNSALKTWWIVVNTTEKINGEPLIGRQCRVFSEIEEEVEQIKADLEEILQAARQRMGAQPRG